MIPPRSPPDRDPRQRGYVTLFIVAIAAAAFLALAGAMQTNACLREWNRRMHHEVQERAAVIPVNP